MLRSRRWLKDSLAGFSLTSLAGLLLTIFEGMSSPVDLTRDDGSVDMEKYPKININLKELPPGFMKRQVVNVPILLVVRSTAPDLTHQRQGLFEHEGEPLMNKKPRCATASAPTHEAHIPFVAPQPPGEGADSVFGGHQEDQPRLEGPPKGTIPMPPPTVHEDLCQQILQCQVELEITGAEGSTEKKVQASEAETQQDTLDYKFPSRMFDVFRNRMVDAAKEPTFQEDNPDGTQPPFEGYSCPSPPVEGQSFPSQPSGTQLNVSDSEVRFN